MAEDIKIELIRNVTKISRAGSSVALSFSVNFSTLYLLSLRAWCLQLPDPPWIRVRRMMVHSSSVDRQYSMEHLLARYVVKNWFFDVTTSIKKSIFDFYSPGQGRFLSCQQMIQKQKSIFGLFVFSIQRRNWPSDLLILSNRTKIDFRLYCPTKVDFDSFFVLLPAGDTTDF